MSLYSEIWPLHVPIASRTKEPGTRVPASPRAPAQRLPHGSPKSATITDDERTEIEEQIMDDEQAEKHMPRLMREYEQDPNLLLKQGPFERRLKERLDERKRKARGEEETKIS